MSDLQLDFFKLNSPPKEEINYYPSFDFVDIIQSYLKIFNINADKSKLDTNLNEFILLIKDAIQKISENNYSGNLILNKLQKDYNETEMEKIIMDLSNFIDYIEYLKLIEENEEVQEEMNIIKNEEIIEDREKEEYRNNIIRELRFSLNLNKQQENESNILVLKEQKGGGLLDDAFLYQGVFESLDQILKDIKPFNILENISGQEREKLREQILYALLNTDGSAAIEEVNNLEPLEKIKFDLFLSDFIYKYYLDSETENYLELYTSNLRKTLGINKPTSEEVQSNNIKDNKFEEQLVEDMKKVNSDLIKYLAFKKKLKMSGGASKEIKKQLKKKMLKLALKTGQKKIKSTEIDLRDYKGLVKKMERYVLIQITIEDGSKEKIANEWINTINSWLSLGSSLFDLILEKDRPFILDIFGKTDPQSKEGETKPKPLEINNPFDLLLSFNDLLLGDYYSFARGTMRYLKKLPIPKFLTQKKTKKSKNKLKKEIKIKKGEYELMKTKKKNKKREAKAREKSEKQEAKAREKSKKNEAKEKKMSLKQKFKKKEKANKKKEKDDATAEKKREKDEAIAEEKRKKDEATAQKEAEKAGTKAQKEGEKAEAKAEKVRKKTEKKRTKDEAKAYAKEEKEKKEKEKRQKFEKSPEGIKARVKREANLEKKQFKKKMDPKQQIKFLQSKESARASKEKGKKSDGKKSDRGRSLLNIYKMKKKLRNRKRRFANSNSKNSSMEQIETELDQQFEGISDDPGIESLMLSTAIKENKLNNEFQAEINEYYNEEQLIKKLDEEKSQAQPLSPKIINAHTSRKLIGGAKDTFNEDIAKRIIKYKSSIKEEDDIELEAMLNIKYRHTLDNKLLKDRNQKFYNQIMTLYKPPAEIDYDSLVKIKSSDSKINYFTYNLLELQELFKKNSTQAIKIFSKNLDTHFKIRKVISAYQKSQEKFKEKYNKVDDDIKDFVDKITEMRDEVDVYYKMVNVFRYKLENTEITYKKYKKINKLFVEKQKDFFKFKNENKKNPNPKIVAYLKEFERVRNLKKLEEDFYLFVELIKDNLYSFKDIITEKIGYFEKITELCKEEVIYVKNEFALISYLDMIMSKDKKRELFQFLGKMHKYFRSIIKSLSEYNNKIETKVKTIIENEKEVIRQEKEFIDTTLKKIKIIKDKKEFKLKNLNREKMFNIFDEVENSVTIETLSNRQIISTCIDFLNFIEYEINNIDTQFIIKKINVKTKNTYGLIDTSNISNLKLNGKTIKKQRKQINKTKKVVIKKNKLLNILSDVEKLTRRIKQSKNKLKMRQSKKMSNIDKFVSEINQLTKKINQTVVTSRERFEREKKLSLKRLNNLSRLKNNRKRSIIKLSKTSRKYKSLVNPIEILLEKNIIKKNGNNYKLNMEFLGSQKIKVTPKMLEKMKKINENLKKFNRLNSNISFYNKI